jgi:hypothetical protein
MATALASVLAGCGGVEDAANDEPTAETVRYELVLTRTDKRGRMVMSGVADYVARRAVVRTSFEGGADAGESFGGEAVQGDESRLFADASYSEWSVGPKDYWVREPTDDEGGYPSEVIAPDPGRDLDPKESLALILDAGGEPGDLGGEIVRGEETTHYRIEVDPKLLSDRLPPPDRLDPAAMEPFGVDVWADSEDRLRRLRITDEMAGGESMTLTYEFFDFGVEVDVDRPTDRVISSERLDELTRPSDEEMRALCEEEIPAEECAAMEESP